MKLTVLASGTGSNLRAIAASIDAGDCGCELVAVVSDKAKAKAIAWAGERGLRTHIEPYRKGDDRDAWNARLAEAVAATEPDVVVLAGFMRVLGPAFVDRFAGRIVNVHPALLPSFPGMHGAAQAVDAGVRISGCTVHVVDAGVDTGPILAQAAVPVLPDDDAASLQERIQRQEHRLLPRVLDDLARGRLRLDPVGAPGSPVGSDDALVAPRFTDAT